jgi:hypothetical protein
MPLSLPRLIRLSGLADQTGLIRPKPSICSKLKISLRYKMDEIGHSFHVIAQVSVSRGVRWFSFGKKERPVRLPVGNVWHYFFICTAICDISSHIRTPRTSGLGTVQNFDDFETDGLMASSSYFI